MVWFGMCDRVIVMRSGQVARYAHRLVYRGNPAFNRKSSGSQLDCYSTCTCCSASSSQSPFDRLPMLASGSCSFPRCCFLHQSWSFYRFQTRWCSSCPQPTLRRSASAAVWSSKFAKCSLHWSKRWLPRGPRACYPGSRRRP